MGVVLHQACQVVMDDRYQFTNLNPAEPPELFKYLREVGGSADFSREPLEPAGVVGFGEELALRYQLSHSLDMHRVQHLYSHGEEIAGGDQVKQHVEGA